MVIYWFESSLLCQTTKAPDTFWSILFSGGWSGVLIMLTLLGLSLWATYLTIDQFSSLRRRQLMPPGLAEAVGQLVSSGKLREAEGACRQFPSVFSSVLLAGLTESDHGWPQVEKGVEDALAEASSLMMRRIEYLNVIGNIAPMVGLLGTVTGMVLAFREVASSAGNAGAGDLAQGIYQALVTTVAGLIIAIPSLGVFAVLRNRVDQLIAEIATAANLVLAPLKRRVFRKGGAVQGNIGGSAPPVT